MQTSRTLEARTLSVASVYMRHVYTWMTAGLGVTSVVALAVAGSPALQQMIFSNFIVMIALIVAQFGIVIALSAAVHKMSATMATGMFMLYSVLTGLTLSSIFIVYPIGAIAMLRQLLKLARQRLVLLAGDIVGVPRFHDA